MDCKTVRIFAYSSMRGQSNKRSGVRLKTESETVGRMRRSRFPREALTLLLLYTLYTKPILRKKTTDCFAV